MHRAIVGYHLDEDGDWVADLSCGHGQHVRHRPPFQVRDWVVEEEGRRARLGSPLDCPLCDRCELPDGLQFERSSPKWDEQTMPTALQRSHRLGGGTWGRIVVSEGQLRFKIRSSPGVDVIVDANASQAIPPEVDHDVQTLDHVGFSIDFLSVRPYEQRIVHHGEPAQLVVDEGGESACYAHLLCPECGVVLDGSAHSEGCHAGLNA